MRSRTWAACREAVDALLDVPGATLSVEELQQAVADLHALSDRLGGYADACLAELSSRTGGQVAEACVEGERLPSGRDVPVHAWLRDRTRCGGTAAGARVRLAERLQHLPVVLGAVVDGRLGRAHAEVLTRLVGLFDDDQLAAAEPGLLEVATRLQPPALAVWVRELIATHCEPALDADERTAETKRYWQSRREDGLLRGSFAVPLGDAETVLTVLEALSRKSGLDDPRNAAQRRADALVEVFDQVLRHGDLPDHGGQRPRVSYVVPAPWAAGEPAPALADTVAVERGSTADSQGTMTSAPLPRARAACATGAWTGPQTRTRIETALCEARLSRVLLDERGQVRRLEALHDEITRAQRQALAARDLGCAARGCTLPPAACDAHHLHRRADGGETSLQNLVLLCRRHHVLWHRGRLRLEHLHVPWLRQVGMLSPSGERVA